VDPLSWNLILAAAGVALVHTLAGPDHYLPFVMLSRARAWSRSRTIAVTLACGLGHVGSSLLLCGIGVALGLGVTQVEGVETARGTIAAWGLVAFGAAYALWGVRTAIRRRTGLAVHEHAGMVHVHPGGDAHHDHHAGEPSRATFWMLFTVFVLGPCEPLVPLFVLPASLGRWDLAAAAAAVFGVVTIAAMAGMVGAACAGVDRLPLGFLSRWTHAVAGGMIALSGLAVIVLGT
jgi:hypothetical protein